MEKTVLFACILSVIEAITKESSWKNLQTVLAMGHLATPPWFATGNATEVGVSMYLTQMRNLGRVELEVTFYLRQTWEDKRLSFPQSQPNDYVALGPTDRSKIWVPDTFIPNELQSTLHSMTAQNDEIRVYFNGTFPHRSDEMILTWSETDPIKFSPDYVSVHLVMMAYYAETCESVLDGEAHSCLRFLMKLDRQHHVVHYMKRQQKRRKAQMEKNKKATENGEEVKEPRKSICRYTSGKVEEIARYLYLLAFIAFNIAYWAYFLT
ncbi:hypothetical protein ScPMuIL_011313 [Solemya velum]